MTAFEMLKPNMIYNSVSCGLYVISLVHRQEASYIQYLANPHIYFLYQVYHDYVRPDMSTRGDLDT
jgi:hypothetical protein